MRTNHINLYLNKITTQNAILPRYVDMRSFLCEAGKARTYLLSYAICNYW